MCKVPEMQTDSLPFLQKPALNFSRSANHHAKSDWVSVGSVVRGVEERGAAVETAARVQLPWRSTDSRQLRSYLPNGLARAEWVRRFFRRTAAGLTDLPVPARGQVGSERP